MEGNIKEKLNDILIVENNCGVQHYFQIRGVLMIMLKQLRLIILTRYQFLHLYITLHKKSSVVKKRNHLIAIRLLASDILIISVTLNYNF